MWRFHWVLYSNAKGPKVLGSRISILLNRAQAFFHVLVVSDDAREDIFNGITWTRVLKLTMWVKVRVYRQATDRIPTLLWRLAIKKNFTVNLIILYYLSALGNLLLMTIARYNHLIIIFKYPWVTRNSSAICLFFRKLESL